MTTSAMDRMSRELHCGSCNVELIGTDPSWWFCGGCGTKICKSCYLDNDKHICGRPIKSMGMTLTDKQAEQVVRLLNWHDMDSGFMHGTEFWCMHCNGHAVEPRDAHTSSCVTRIARELKAAITAQKGSQE